MRITRHDAATNEITYQEVTVEEAKALGLIPQDYTEA